MGTLFISDLHLSAEHPAVSRLFLQLLTHYAPHLERLYILGDLFEVWLGDDLGVDEYRTELDALAALNAADITCSVMHGNRDFLLGRGFESASGCTLLTDPSEVSLYGHRALLMHGDSLCRDDHDYQRLRTQLRDPQWQAEFLAQSPGQRRAFARQARQQSQAATRNKHQDIMDVNPLAVADTLREYHVRHLIHGHTHRPAVHRCEHDGGPAWRTVLGDWRDSDHDGGAEILFCDAAGCSLRHFTFHGEAVLAHLPWS